MRHAFLYLACASLGFFASLQGCDCKSDPDASPDASTPSPEASAPLPDAGDAATGDSGDASACLDQDPPAGFSTVSSGQGKLGVYGEQVAMTLDADGSPLVGFVHFSPSGASASTDSILYFTRWDRCIAKWTTPVNVDVVGAIAHGGALRQVAIARDAVTGAIGLAFSHVVQNADNAQKQMWFAFSKDRGATWSKAQVSDGHSADLNQTGSPGLAMNADKVHLAYWQEGISCVADPTQRCNGWYVEGKPAAWTRTVLPSLPAADGLNLAAPVIVALDSAMKPAVGFVTAPLANNTQIAFWRPGTAAAVKVTDSAGSQNDDPSMAMAFDGVKPRIATTLAVAVGATAESLVVKSNDGLTWDAPITLPHDGDDATSFFQTIAIGPNGSIAVAARSNTGSGTAVCGAPKVSRSTNGTTFTTCGADATKMVAGVGGNYVTAAFTKSGKLMLALQVTDDASSLAPGVAIWREQ